ncbi:MAG: LysR family transcriptional regulator [Bdellovibrionota bacterium]|nr:LysR family transcriptional regulator [Bdellovibrionota bacterium]
MLKKLKDINWNHLYCFYEVAKAKSLKDGTKVLGVASSTASEQIKKLEETIGLKLFHRSSRGLMLTKEGENLFAHTREIFEAGSKLLDDISVSDVGGYSVTVGIEETISHSVAAEFCSQYWDFYTQFGTVNTSRQYEHQQLVENLNNGNLDWGISLKPPTKKSIDYAKIGSFELVFACSSELYHQFLEKEDILRNIPMAQVSWDVTLNESINNFLKEYEVQPKEYIQSDHQEYIMKLCDRGRCVMVIVENPMEEYEGLTKFSIGKSLKINLYALWPKKKENLLSIKKLKDLITSKLENVPTNYTDQTYQIEVNEVSEELLKGE